MQKVGFLSLFLFIFNTSFTIPEKKETGKVNWLSFEEVEKKLAEKELPILIDVYTDWCGWCKVMDQKTYSKANVSNYLNEKFYAVKFNAESKKDITWNGKVYKYDAVRKMHALSYELMTGDMGFPSTVFITNKDSVPQSIAGYMTPAEMQVLVTFFGEKKYAETDFETYAREFKPSW